MSKAENIAEKKKEVVLYYASMPVYKYAAHSVGISEKTLERWRADDPSFDDSLNQARSTFFNKLGKRMKPEFMAERLDREVWALQTGGDEGYDVIGRLLESYGVIEGKGNDTKTDESISGSSQSQT